MANAQWNFAGDKAKLLALGAPNNNTSDLEAIVASRHARKEEISSLLSINASDVVLDLGSGMGFLAEVIAPEVKELHCADISETYLDDCRARLSAVRNARFHLINYGDLSPLDGAGITKAYSTLLFIHFNFYDLYYYLTELNRVIALRGLVYFDYNDGERIDLQNRQDSFFQHLQLYRHKREQWVFNCMHMLSYGTIRNVASQLGFEILKDIPYENHCFSRMVLRKVRSV